MSRLASLVPLALGACLCSAPAARPARPEPPTVWTVPAMTRVMREEAPRGERAITLRAARGEWEAFQVVVWAPAAGLTNVRVAASDLTGPADSRIPAANVALFRERYVVVKRGSPDLLGKNRPLGPGAYPDGLVPFASDGAPNPQATPFAIAPHRHEAVWVDVRVPHGIAAGAYAGTIRVDSDQGGSEARVTVVVWDFDLPARPSLRSHFGVWSGSSGDPRFARLLLEHRVMPSYVRPSDARELIDGFGLNVTGLPIYSHRKGCTLDPAPTEAEVERVASGYPADLGVYVFVVDEPWVSCTERATLDAQTVAWAARVHRTRARTLVTDAPSPALLDDGSGTGRSAADIWVPSPRNFDPADASFQAARAKGDEIWAYTALVSDTYSPKWEIDFAPINFRILPGFIAQSLALDGILYWSVNAWDTADPWSDPTYYTRECVFPPCAFPGEGILLYPGAPVGVLGPVPSMRLKWIREGVEDFEYVALLRRLGHGDAALRIARTVGADWRSWTKDPAALETARVALGEALHALHPRTTPP